MHWLPHNCQSPSKLVRKDIFEKKAYLIVKAEPNSILCVSTMTYKFVLGGGGGNHHKKNNFPTKCCYYLLRQKKLHTPHWFHFTDPQGEIRATEIPRNKRTSASSSHRSGPAAI